jgi:CheY-like chemotaxis protein
MLPKSLRILIADANQQRCLSVEKLINHAGCYGVGVVGTADELAALLNYPGRPFDVVLINCRLLDQANTDTLDLLQQHSNVVLYRNGLYSGQMADPDSVIREGLCGLPSAAPGLHQAFCDSGVNG